MGGAQPGAPGGLVSGGGGAGGAGLGAVLACVFGRWMGARVPAHEPRQSAAVFQTRTCRRCRTLPLPVASTSFDTPTTAPTAPPTAEPHCHAHGRAHRHAPPPRPNPRARAPQPRARARAHQPPRPSTPPPHPPKRYVLDFVAERKSVQDLLSSITSERYAVQKMAMQGSGLGGLLYIVEGGVDGLRQGGPAGAGWLCGWGSRPWQWGACAGPRWAARGRGRWRVGGFWGGSRLPGQLNVSREPIP